MAHLPHPSSCEPAIERCPACGADGATLCHARTFRGKRWGLARCGRCDQHYTTPTPTESELNDFYAGDYHVQLRAEGETDAAFGAKYERYAETIARHLPDGRVVDIGCSTGLFVRMLKDRGYDAEGIELNAESAAWGSARYGVRISTEPIERSGLAPGSLDAILLTDVLEHMRHPGEFLASAARYVALDGFALVTFPDIRSIESLYRAALARFFRREWLFSSCHVPLHVWEFTRPTAERCFERAGFRVVDFRRSQLPPERHASLALRLLDLPTRCLSWPLLGRLAGSQMEFLLQKVRDLPEETLPDSAAGAAHAEGREPPERRTRALIAGGR